MKKRVAVAAISIAAITSGSMWFASAPAAPGAADNIKRNSRGQEAVSSDVREHEGWLSEDIPTQWVDVTLPDGESVQLGVGVVVNDANKPIGCIGPWGMRRGGVTPDGQLTPAAAARIKADPGIHNL